MRGDILTNEKNVLEKPNIDNHDWMGRVEQELFITLALIETAEEARDFMLDLFTKEEIQIAAKRWCVTCSLLDGTSQDETRIKCNTSKNTVSRSHQNIVKYGTGISIKLHKRLLKIRKGE